MTRETSPCHREDLQDKSGHMNRPLCPCLEREKRRAKRQESALENRTSSALSLQAVPPRHSERSEESYLRPGKNLRLRLRMTGVLATRRERQSVDCIKSEDYIEYLNDYCGISRKREDATFIN